MVTTTFAAVALSTVLSAGAVAVPNVQTDYSKAMTTAVAQQKPLAVFIGHGDAGYAGLVGGEIPADAGQLLAKSFVCVYVNTDTESGKTLAGQFELKQGLVISCKGGNVQALRHNGTVAPADLTKYLTKYSQTSAVVTTEKIGEVSTVVPAGAVMGGCPNGRCGVTYSGAAYAPAQGYAPTFAPAYYQGFSTCPNGKCPNAR